jgi:methyl-accepting chemotaxis protein
MTSLGMLGIVAAVLAALAGAVVAWMRWRGWRGEEQDTRLLTGIVDLRRSVREGQLHVRLPAKGRGFTRDVETAVNRLIDEVVAHFRARRTETEALTGALDALAAAALRTVERLDATVVQVEGLGVELGRRAAATVGDAPILEALAALRAGDERFADHCRSASTLVGRLGAAASDCQQAFAELRSSLAEVADEMAGATRSLAAFRARWTAVRTGVEDVARVAGTTQVLAVSAALAAGRGNDVREDLDRIAAEVDEVAHGVSRGLARITGAVAACEEGMASLLAETRQGGVAADEISALEGALARIGELPSHLAELATALSGIAASQAQATSSLTSAHPDASRLADELQTWTALAQRVGSELAEATDALTAARREAQRLLQVEAAP